MKIWSSTRKIVVLSSDEVDLIAVVVASTETSGIIQMAAGWGLDMTRSLYVDSSTLLAVDGRKGDGRLRHVRVGDLWI